MRYANRVMSLFRLLTLAIVVWLLVLAYKRFVAPAKRTRAASPRIGTMVRCAVCGLHVPEAEAVKRRDQYFCCAEHRDKEPV